MIWHGFRIDRRSPRTVMPMSFKLSLSILDRDSVVIRFCRNVFVYVFTVSIGILALVNISYTSGPFGSSCSAMLRSQSIEIEYGGIVVYSFLSVKGYGRPFTYHLNIR